MTDTTNKEKQQVQIIMGKHKMSKTINERTNAAIINEKRTKQILVVPKPDQININNEYLI